MIMSDKDKSDKIKLLVVGLGGIGSQLTELIVPALDISGLNVELNLMDNDVVDESNLAHQRFSREDKNSHKVEALHQRYQRYEHVQTIAHKNNLTMQSQLEGFDIIVVAVDRQEPRNLVHRSDAHTGLILGVKVMVGYLSIAIPTEAFSTRFPITNNQ